MNNRIEMKKFFNSSFLISTEKGEKLYPVILRELEGGREITLDFKDIKSTITAFFYAWYGRLFEKYTKEELEKRIKFENLSLGSKQQIETVVDTSQQFYQDKE